MVWKHEYVEEAMDQLETLDNIKQDKKELGKEEQKLFLLSPSNYDIIRSEHNLMGELKLYFEEKITFFFLKQ